MYAVHSPVITRATFNTLPFASTIVLPEIVAPVWADALAVDTEVTAAGFVFVPTNCTSATGAVSERTATSVDSTN